MKATGIVRRIDDLGRVVIPKEIRRTMRIREGDPLEIFTNGDGGVVFKKYSLMGGLGDFSAQLCESLYKTTGKMVTITDRDACISVAGGGPAAADLCRRVAAELRRAGVQRLRPAAPKAGQLAAGGSCAAGVSVAAHLAVPVCARVALPYALHAAGAERCRRTAAGCGADQNFSCAGSALRAYALRGGDGRVPALHRTGAAPDPV